MKTTAALLASLAALAATPASAQSFSKSDAILGGAPSRLAALMAAQSAGGEASTAALLDTPIAAMVRPAVATTTMAPRPVLAVANGERPDVFNSVALPVHRSSLDGRWSSVAGSHVSGAAARVASALRDEDPLTRIAAVNRYVNARVTFVDDQARFGVADRWGAAMDTLASGRGDCEDYAIAKLAMLRAAGIADKNLYLVILKDLARRADHAVLVVRAEGRFLVLDNGTDRLIDSAEIRDYRPILTFTRGHTYTHGYRRETLAPVDMARAEPLRPVAPAAAPMEALDVAALAAPQLGAALAATFQR